MKMEKPCCEVKIVKTEKGFSADVEVKDETCCSSGTSKKEKKK